MAGGVTYSRIRLPGVINLSSGNMSVKSIQSISQTINHTNAGTYSDTTTITSVDVTRTLVFMKNIYGNIGGVYGAEGSVILNSATQVLWALRITGTGTVNITGYADVVEFNSPFKSIQYVVGTSGAKTINAVNTAKTFIMSCNFAHSQNISNAYALLTNSTTVTVTNGLTAEYYVVVEMY